MVDDDTVLQRRPEPLTAQVDGETVMFHPDEGSYFALGAVGTRVWALLDDPVSLAALIQRLQGEFDVEEATCRGDVLKFVDELIDSGLIEVQP